MKIRNGFVSNSSSSSFVIKKDSITPFQIELIRNHMEIGKRFDIYQSWRSDDSFDEWAISEDDMEIRGSTIIDNFDMDAFLEKIGVPENKIEWSDY